MKMLPANVNSLTVNQIESLAANLTAAKTAVSMLLSMQEYKESKKIGVYLSMPASEINTRVIVYDAFRHGKQVFVPYIYKQLHPKQGQPKSIMDMLELRSADEYESLNQDGWGIPTLSTGSVEFRLNCLGGTGLSKLGDEEVGENDGLDVLVMPGLVFDMHMGRVGHGKGFYDFFLQRYKDSHKDVPKKEMPLLGKNHYISP